MTEIGPNPGSCLCGCGQPTQLALKSNSARGWVKGQPVRFCHGHAGGRKSVPLALRFWNRVDIGGPAECWPWLGGRVNAGYGRAAERDVTEFAHRVAYRLTYGDIPEGLFVIHSCDNPPCCNPAHLRAGTPADNSRDRVVRGRSLPGELSPSRVLTADDVRAIRASDGLATISSLARQYGVSRTTIRSAMTGVTWRTVDGVR